MRGMSWDQLAQTITGRHHAGLGSASPWRGRRGRQARPLLVPLEERCLLSFGSPSLLDTGASNNAVALGDVNGDGIPDLVAAATSNALTVATGCGDGRFHAPSPAITSASASSFSGVTLADLDGQHGLD